MKRLTQRNENGSAEILYKGSYMLFYKVEEGKPC